MNAEKLEKIVVQCLEAACAFKKPVANVKIVSGGQTGVDRGALEAATARASRRCPAYRQGRRRAWKSCCGRRDNMTVFCAVRHISEKVK